MNKRNLLLTAALTLALPAMAHAEAPTEVIVSLTRQTLPVAKVGQAVSVLDDKTITSYQSVFLADLLTHTPDLSLTRNGGPGEAASASIRGAGADHTLYLLDGVRLNDPSQVGGGSNLGLIATDDSARIEVLRGPLSTLWGSGALGGVVSLTSRDPHQPLEAQAALEGYDDYSRLSAGVGGKQGRLTWRLFGNALKDDGVSAFAGGTETDPFNQTTFDAKAAFSVTDSTTVRAFTAYARSKNAYDGYLPPSYAFTDTDEYGRTNTRLSYIAVNNHFGHGEQTLSLSTSETNRHDYFADDTQFVARGGITSADYHLLFRPDDATRLLGGATYERDTMRIASPAPWDPNPTPLSVATTTASIYGQAARDFGATTVSLSARHDDSSSFGAQDIAQLAVTTAVNDTIRLHASAGQGVKTPSLYQLYSDYGTPTLTPETGLTIDAGIDLTLGHGTFGLTAFTRTVRDLIDFRYDGCTSTQPYGCYGNIDRSKASGLELEATQTLGAITLRGNYSLLDTTNQSPGLNGKKLPHTPDQMGSLDLDWQATPALSLGAGLRHVGDSFDNASNTRRLAAYDLVDLRVSYNLNPTVRLYGRIENAGDTRYETASNYGQAGRRLWLGIALKTF